MNHPRHKTTRAFSTRGRVWIDTMPERTRPTGMTRKQWSNTKRLAAAAKRQGNPSPSAPLNLDKSLTLTAPQSISAWKESRFLKRCRAIAERRKLGKRPRTMYPARKNSWDKRPGIQRQ